MTRSGKARPRADRGQGGKRPCSRVRTRVYGLLGGHMSDRKRDEVWRHMKAGGKCFSRHEFARIMRNLVRRTVTRELCPVHLARRIRKNIFASSRRAA